MKPFLDYSKKLIHDFLYEDYSYVNIRFLAFKEEGGEYVITNIKLDFSSKEASKLRYFFSFDNKVLYVEDVVEIDILSQRIEKVEDVFYYKINDSKYKFHQNINIPPSYESFRSIVDSRYQKYLMVHSKNLMGFVFFNTLYNLEGVFYEYTNDIYIQTEGSIPEIKYPIFYIDYSTHKFIIDADIKSGQNIFEEKFGVSSRYLNIPFIIIEYPIESFKFGYKVNIHKKKCQILLEWDINEAYQSCIEFIYAFQGKKHLVETKLFRIEGDLNEFEMIDFIVSWNGDEQLIPQGSRLYLKFLHSLINIPQTKNNIKALKLKGRLIITKNKTEQDLNKILNYFYELAKNYRSIAMEYLILGGSTGINYSKRVWLYRRLERKAYEKVISKYSEKIPIEDQQFYFFLRLNNLLYRDHLDNKDFVYRERKRRLKEKLSFSYFGISPIEEINAMHYNIKRAVDIIQREIRDGLKKKDSEFLLERFEILGDLHIHEFILKLISDEMSFHFRKDDIDLELAIQCYKKALKYKRKIEIPGVGLLSTRYQDYMSIYNEFMEEGYLEKKIEYLKSLKEPSEAVEHVIDIQAPILLNTLIDEISLKCKDLQISKSDIIYFLEQFKEDDLKYAMAILLKNTKFMTIYEVIEELSKLIRNNVSDLENTFILLFHELSLKSNVLYQNLLPRLSGYEYKIIPASTLLEQLNQCSSDTTYDFIFIDDVIGTGTQCIETISRNFTNQISQIKEIINNSPNIRFLVMACFGSQDSKKRISTEIPFIQRNDIYFANTIRPKDKAFSPKEGISYETMERLKEFLKKVDPKYWRGRENSKFLVVLETNTPNNSIGCLWRRKSGINPLSSRIQYSRLDFSDD